MSEFNETNWKAALSSVYHRALTDAAFRALCVRAPREAVAEVSEVDLPADFNFRFIENSGDLTYTYLLPSAVDALRTDEDFQKWIERNASGTGTDTKGPSGH